MRTRILIALAMLLCMGTFGQLSTNLVVVPWQYDPANTTNYTHTNLPTWWHGGTNFLNWTTNMDAKTNVFQWQGWQAVAHNFEWLTHYVETNIWDPANLPAVLTNQIDTVGYVKIANGKVVFAEDGTLYASCGVSWADTGIITAGGFQTLFGTINLLVDGSANLGNNGLTIGTAGELSAAAYRFPTNSAPTHWTNGVTAPDFWAQIYSADGSAMGWTPVWTNH